MRTRKTLAALMATCATVLAVVIAPTAAHADWQVGWISVLKPAGASATMVMNVQNGSSANLTPVQLWQVVTSGTGNQVWRFRDTGRYDANGLPGYQIYNPMTEKCLDRRIDLGIGNGNAVQIYDCTGALNQTWWPVAVGTSTWGLLKNGSDRRCLDVKDFNYANGARLQVWDCGTNWNQRWNIEP